MSQHPKKATAEEWRAAGFALVVIVVIVGYFLYPKSRQRATAATHQALQSLATVPEVAWYRIGPSDVYIGLRDPVAEEWDTIARFAAVRGNRSTGKGYHAWAVPAAKQDFDPSRDPFYACATARGGKVQSFDLPGRGR